MQGLKQLIVVTNRQYSESYLDFFRKFKVARVMSKLCNGTANEKTLDIMGIEKTEKIMFEAFIREELLDDIIKGLLTETDISVAGNGIAMVIPVDGIGGSSSLEFFAGEAPIEKKEIKKVMDSSAVLIVTVVDKGNTELVMDSAREVGASGGTVVHAKGTGAEIAKFFGVSISEEKEMVYIVAKRSDRDNIMHAIMEKAGPNTDAHGVLFSLPVDKVVGIRSFEI